jgi:predicted amidohydrolase YtcJ
MPSPAMLATIGRLGVVASIQPMFDALWGGPHGMYAERLGDRWRLTNPFLALETAHVALALGSDSPVTPLGPWAAIRAAAYHHHPEQRLPVAAALHAHTRGGALAGRDDDGGSLGPGARADLAVWDVPSGFTDDGHPDLTHGAELPRLLRTVAAGRTIHTTEDAS